MMGLKTTTTVVIMMAMAMTAILANGQHCPESIPAAQLYFPQSYNHGTLKNYTWLISLTSPSIDTPEGMYACPTPVYAAQYTSGVHNCLPYPPTTSVTDKGCHYNISTPVPVGLLTYNVTVDCDPAATVLQPPDAFVVVENKSNPQNYTYVYSGTFRSAAVCVPTPFPSSSAAPSSMPTSTASSNNNDVVPTSSSAATSSGSSDLTPMRSGSMSTTSVGSVSSGSSGSNGQLYNCPTSIPAATFNFPQLYNGVYVDYDWLISLTSPSDMTPPNNSACPQDVFIGQYVPGGYAAACISTPPTISVITDLGCNYRFQQTDGDTTRTYNITVGCDSTAPTLMPPVAFVATNQSASVFTFTGTFTSAAVCGGGGSSTPAPTSSMSSGTAPPQSQSSSTTMPSSSSGPPDSGLNCPTSIPAATFNFPQLYNGVYVDYDWLISLTSPSDMTPPNNSACPQDVFIGQYVPGGYAAACISTPPTISVITDLGCNYRFQQTDGDTTRTYNITVGCDSTAPTLMPPVAFVATNQSASVFTFTGTFTSAAVCGGGPPTTSSSTTTTSMSTSTTTTTTTTTTPADDSNEVAFTVNSTKSVYAIRDAIANAINVAADTITIISDRNTTAADELSTTVIMKSSSNNNNSRIVVMRFSNTSSANAAISKANDGSLATVGVTSAAAVNPQTTTTTAAPRDNNNNDNKKETIIAAAVSASVALLFIIAVVVFVVRRRNREGSEEEYRQLQEDDDVRSSTSMPRKETV